MGNSVSWSRPESFDNGTFERFLADAARLCDRAKTLYPNMVLTGPEGEGEPAIRTGLVAFSGGFGTGDFKLQQVGDRNQRCDYGEHVYGVLVIACLVALKCRFPEITVYTGDFSREQACQLGFNLYRSLGSQGFEARDFLAVGRYQWHGL